MDAPVDAPVDAPGGAAPAEAASLTYPLRFRGAPQRSARIARPLRLVSRVATVDEALVDQLGRRMFARDELGADLARAMRLRDRSDPERVTAAQVRRALADGIGAVPDVPPALARLFAVVDQVPAWVDFDLVERGGRAVRRMGRTGDDVMLQLALIGGYRFGGPADLLVA
nr:hypothetical protein [Micromonospora sp. DSM 115978]